MRLLGLLNLYILGTAFRVQALFFCLLFFRLGYVCFYSALHEEYSYIFKNLKKKNCRNKQTHSGGIAENTCET